MKSMFDALIAGGCSIAITVGITIVSNAWRFERDNLSLGIGVVILMQGLYWTIYYLQAVVRSSGKKTNPEPSTKS